MSEERRARRTSSKPGNLSTGPAERERLPVRMPAPATTRTEPVRPRSTTQRSSVQAAQHQPSQPNTAGSTHSLATNSVSRSTPISLHGAHPGRGGDMTPIPLAHRGSSKKLQKSSKSAEDERKPLHANRHNQRPPSIQRVGLGFDFPTSSEEPIPRPTPSSSQSSARSSALKYSSFSDDSDDDDRLATEPQPRPIPLRPASLSPVPRVSPDNRPSSHRYEFRDHHAVSSGLKASGVSESHTRNDHDNRRAVSNDLPTARDHDENLRLLAAVPPRRAPVPAVSKTSEPDNYAPDPIQSSSKFVKLKSRIGRDGVNNGDADNQRPVASPSQTSSLRTARPSDKFSSLKRSISPVGPTHEVNRPTSRASAASPRPTSAAPSLVPETSSVALERGSGPRGLKGLKIPTLSSRFQIGKGRSSTSPVPSAEPSPVAGGLGSRIPNSRGSRSSSLPGTSPTTSRTSASPQVQSSGRLAAHSQPQQAIQLAPRKTSAASTVTTSGTSTTSDSRTFVNESDSTGVPSSIDPYSDGKSPDVHLFTTNPDPASSSSIDSVSLPHDRRWPSASHSLTSSLALSAPGAPIRSRLPSDARRMNALMDGLGLVSGAAAEPQHGDQQGHPGRVEAPSVSWHGAEEPELSSEQSSTLERVTGLNTARRSSEDVGQSPRWTAPPPSKARRPTMAQYHEPSIASATSGQDESHSVQSSTQASEGADSRPQSRVSNRDRWAEYYNEHHNTHSPYGRGKSRPPSRATNTYERDSRPPSSGSRGDHHNSTPLVRDLVHVQSRTRSVSPQDSPASDYHDERYNNEYLPSHETREEEYLEGDDHYPHAMAMDHFEDDQGPNNQEQDTLPTPTSDTDLSSFGSFSQSDWRPANEAGISTAAEALFHDLKGPKVMISSSSYDALPPRASPRPVSIPQAEDDKSFDFDFSSTRSQCRTWRSTVTPAAYEALRARHGEFELQRQELIWDICESERTFLRNIRVVLKTYIQPLRNHDRHWLPGVPSEVARVFDWLDDIVQLHAQMHSALHAARSKQYPVIVHVAETLRPFVARLEIHQPYLARFNQAMDTIRQLLEDSESDFGEFVRMQLQEVPELNETSLADALKLPNQLVMEYPNVFQALYQRTPRNHPDHLAAFSLFHSTDLVVRAMLEVHAREEEYDCVKDLAKRIIGLPLNFNLASRERRLVAQGMLRRVHLTESERLVLERSAELPAEDDSASLCMPIVAPQYLATNSPLRPIEAFNWSKAVDSFDYASTHSGTGSTSSADVIAEVEERDTSSAWRSSRASPLRLKRDIIYVFVFSDIVLFASRSGPDTDSWKLLDDVGMARVTAVVDQSGKLGYDHLLGVDVLPMVQERGGINVSPMDCIPCPVFLTLCDRTSSRKIPPKTLDDAKLRWIEAFHKCFLFTLRSLSFPCHGDGDDDLAHGPTADFEMDTKTSVMSILSVGLPMPKSPSQLIGEHQRGRPVDPTEEEREERGWWAVRFRQVLREIQRQEILLLLPEQPVALLNTVATASLGRSQSHLLPPALAATRMQSTPSIETHSRRRSILSSRPLLLSANIGTITLNSTSPARG